MYATWGHVCVRECVCVWYEYVRHTHHGVVMEVRTSTADSLIAP